MKPSLETRIRTQANIEPLPILLNAIRDDLKIRDVDMANLCRVTPHTLATWRKGSAVPKDFAQVYCISVALVEWDRDHPQPTEQEPEHPPTTEAGYFEFVP